MNKLYNTQEDLTSGLWNFFVESSVPLSKPNLFNLSSVIISMINAKSVVTASIADSIDSPLFSNNLESIQKRIWRLFNNPKVNIYDTYKAIIKNVISNISNVRHDELIVTLDHMFTKNNFVTLMFTLRIDNQGIPLWFYCEATSSNSHQEIKKDSCKEIFSEAFIKNAIKEVIDLLKPLHCKIIFLADRWFFNLEILKFINDNNCKYCFRAKAKSNVKVFAYDKKEGHKIYKNLPDFKPYVFKTAFFENLEFGNIHFKANLAIAPSCRLKKETEEDDEEDNWYIITNLKPKLAIKKYKKRYGAIEMLFKNQKTNGFYLEKTKTKNIHAFEVLYGACCIATLWLDIIAIDYIKNYNHKKDIVNIKFNKPTKSGKKTRILSTFKLGMTLFHFVYKKSIPYILKCNFKLYL